MQTLKKPEFAMKSPDLIDKAEGRMWMEVIEQLQQLCRSIVASHDFHVAVLRSQDNLSSKMRDFTLSLGDRMQNLSINMKSQTASLGQRLEGLAESVSSLESALPAPYVTREGSKIRSRGGPVGAAPGRYG